MPLYDFRCPRCGATKTEIFRMDKLPDGIPCGCGAEMKRIYSVSVIPDIEPYVDYHISADGMPVYVRSRQHKRELMRRNFARESEKSDAEVRRKVKEVKEKIMDSQVRMV